MLRLKEEGIKVHIVGKKPDIEYTGKHGLKATSDLGFHDIDYIDYDGILIPGGWAPDKLRRYSKVKKIVKNMDEANKIIATICHAGWVIASANIINNRKVTSVSAIKDDLINAGANWVNKNVVVDENLITSRTPKDLPVYAKTIIKQLAD